MRPQTKETNGVNVHLEFGVSMPWAQGVGRSNRPAPTKSCIYNMLSTTRERTFRHRAHVASAVDRQSLVEKQGLLPRGAHRESEFFAFGIYNFDYNPVY